MLKILVSSTRERSTSDRVAVAVGCCGHCCFPAYLANIYTKLSLSYFSCYFFPRPRRFISRSPWQRGKNALLFCKRPLKTHSILPEEFWRERKRRHPKPRRARWVNLQRKNTISEIQTRETSRECSSDYLHCVKQLTVVVFLGSSHLCSSVLCWSSQPTYFASNISPALNAQYAPSSLHPRRPNRIIVGGNPSGRVESSRASVADPLKQKLSQIFRGFYTATSRLCLSPGIPRKA